MRKALRFSVQARDKKSRARAAVIVTAHGAIETPAFIPVGTQASVKSLTPQELSTLGVQIFFVNTYHVYLRPGVDVIADMGGLHRFMAWDKPLITDSGGFQIFSLARDTYRPNSVMTGDRPRTARIDESGVQFFSHWDGSTHRFTPEKSIRIQHALGADIILAFDDCTPYPVTHEKARLSMERTHRWAQRSCTEHTLLNARKTRSKKNIPALYGVIQGSVYEDLRMQSAQTISSMDFDGIAIGGVSVGESKGEMRNVMSWILPVLPDEKPRHLLGVGEIDDIFALIEAGVDTFDCVQPTRLARMGHVYQYQKSLRLRSGQAKIPAKRDLAPRDKNQKYTIDITKSCFARDAGPLDPACSCSVCQTFSRAYLHHLFHVRELLAYRLATMHNIAFVHDLVREMRQAIRKGTFLALKKQWLYNND